MSHLTAKDVDTKEEIQAIVDAINKNKMPSFTSNQTATAQLGNIAL